MLFLSERPVKETFYERKRIEKSYYWKPRYLKPNKSVQICDKISKLKNIIDIKTNDKQRMLPMLKYLHSIIAFHNNTNEKNETTKKLRKTYSTTHSFYKKIQNHFETIIRAIHYNLYQFICVWLEYYGNQHIQENTNINILILQSDYYHTGVKEFNLHQLEIITIGILLFEIGKSIIISPSRNGFQIGTRDEISSIKASDYKTKDGL